MLTGRRVELMATEYNLLAEFWVHAVPVMPCDDLRRRAWGCIIRALLGWSLPT